MLRQLREKLPSLSDLRVDHHYLGRYSIEKLHLFEQYQRTASPLRVTAVILLTPLPTLVVLAAMDFAPLNDPLAGASQNIMAFVRSTISHAVMTFFTLLPFKQALALSHREYSFTTIAWVACCTALSIEALCIPLAFTWRFPVPFREMIGLPVFVLGVCGYNYAFATHTIKRLWRRGQVQRYVPLAAVQLVLFFVFLGMSVGFAHLSLLPQTVMILVFPIIKMLLKHVVWKYAQQLRDISTDVTICMLDISGALYQTVCMQFVNSPVLNVLIVATDFMQAALEVRTYVQMDYLGDGRHTLTTALKIVESSLFDSADSRRTTQRSSALTHSIISTTEGHGGGETSSSAYEAATTARRGSDLNASFSRRFSLRRPRRSSIESMSSTTRGDDDSVAHAAVVAVAAAVAADAQQTIQQQANSVVMQPRGIHERRVKGKRQRRRLLDLDLMQVELSGGRFGSQGRNASLGRISQDEILSSGSNDTALFQPAVLTKSMSSNTLPTRSLAFLRSNSARTAVVHDAAALVSTDLIASVPAHDQQLPTALYQDPSNAVYYHEQHHLVVTKSAFLPVKRTLSERLLHGLQRTATTLATTTTTSTNTTVSPVLRGAATSASISYLSDLANPPQHTILERETNDLPYPLKLKKRRSQYLALPMAVEMAPPTMDESLGVQSSPLVTITPLDDLASSSNTSGSITTITPSSPSASASVSVAAGGPSPLLKPAPAVHPRRSRRRRLSSTSIDGISISRRDQARILEQTLQLMFASEVLLFVEYMEVVIPVLYALVIGSEYVLPNGNYNLVVRNMTRPVVESQIWNALLYALLELVSMLAMYWVMKTKYGVSAMYQLAFVLEKYWMTLQGKLLGSFIVVLNAVTVHQGTDFTVLFGSPGISSNTTRSG